MAGNSSVTAPGADTGALDGPCLAPARGRLWIVGCFGVDSKVSNFQTLLLQVTLCQKYGASANQLAYYDDDDDDDDGDDHDDGGGDDVVADDESMDESEQDN